MNPDIKLSQTHNDLRQNPPGLDFSNSHPLETKKQASDTHIEIGGKKTTRSAIEKASLFSLLHFLFAVRLIRFVNSLRKKPLKLKDLNTIGDSERCKTLEHLFTKNYQELSLIYPKKRRVLTFILWRIFRKDVFIQLFWQLTLAISRILVAYFLYLMIGSIRDPNGTVSYTYKVALGFFLCSLVGFYSTHQFNFNLSYAVNKMKVGILGMMFRKINRLSLQSVHEMSLGKLLNVVANDLNNLERINFVVSIPIAPFILFGSMCFLYFIWGVSCLVGIGYMALIGVLQKFIVDRTLIPRREKTMAMDKRLSFLNEALEAIKLIKIQRWEFLSIDKIRNFRQEEISKLKKFNFIESIVRTLVGTSHWIAGFLIFLTYTATGGVITPKMIFPTIYLLTHLRQICLIQVFNGFSFIVEMKLLFFRIMSIMSLPEINPHEEVLKPDDPHNAIEFVNFSGLWVYKEEANKVNKNNPLITKPQDVELTQNSSAISNINLQVKHGDLVAIIGGAGSGKSSLLLSFTNEMSKHFGKLHYEGKYAYVAQQPVLFFGPLKNSIIFGKPYDEVFFWKVLEACHIADEIRNLPEKEMTEIGERGAIFSRSQKTRLALARAIYTRADIYLLDDPLSVHDTKLAKQIFKDAIQGLLRNKTVLLVTHQLNLASYANQVVVMSAGRIEDAGTYGELSLRRKTIREWFELSNNNNSPKNEVIKEERLAPNIYVPPGRMETIKEIKEEVLEAGEGEQQLNLSAPDEGLFIDNERLDDGRVTLRIYWKYFKSVFNWFTILPMIALFVGCECISWLFMVKMGMWGRGEYTNEKGYAVISALAFGSLAIYLAKFLLYYNSTLNGSHKLHNKMLKGVFQSPMRFYHKNPLGRILSRFSNDIGILDKFMIAALLEVLEGFCLFMVFLVALWIESPWIFISAAVATFFYILIVTWCKRTTDQTRGLELTTRSPLYSLFSIEINGLTTIRALKQTEDATQAFYARADDHSKANIAYITSFRFMSFLIDYITELTVIVTFIVLIPVNNTPLKFGFFVNILALLPNTLQWVLKGFMNLNLLMASAARVINYCENYKVVELQKPNDKEHPEGNWPKGGEIEVKNASMRYSDTTEPIVKNLSLYIHAGEKIAVVGSSRTGMSSIVYMLLNMYKIDKTGEEEEFYIKVNGVNISDIGIHLLRNSMTIMSENFYIFTATIRENLDPWKRYKEEDLWKVLEIVELKEKVENFKDKLETKLSKGSSVFSMGQKELLCVARALLEKKPILIQDEPLSHVDFPTFDRIQRKILEAFPNSTILTMTHRFSNLEEYDRVLILKNGAKVEFNEPYRLLVKEIGDNNITNKNSHFATLLLNQGSNISEKLFRKFKRNYYKKRHLPLEDDKSCSSTHSLNQSSETDRISSFEGTDSFPDSNDEKDRRGSTPKVDWSYLRKAGFLSSKTVSTDQLLGDKFVADEPCPNLLMKIKPRRFTQGTQISTGTPRSSYSTK